MKKVRLVRPFQTYEVGHIFDGQQGTFMGGRVWRLLVGDKFIGVGEHTVEEVEEINGEYVSLAMKLVNELREKYGLTYRCSVNLEATINNMRLAGILWSTIRDVIEDLYDNFEVLEGN